MLQVHSKDKELGHPRGQCGEHAQDGLVFMVRAALSARLGGCRQCHRYREGEWESQECSKRDATEEARDLVTNMEQDGTSIHARAATGLPRSVPCVALLWYVHSFIHQSRQRPTKRSKT